MEYLTVYVTWQYFIHPRISEENLKQNFDLNMQALADHVNKYLAMGWQPLGPPTFSSSWLSRTRHGLAIQALTRVALPVAAKEVRSSVRRSRQKRN